MRENLYECHGHLMLEGTDYASARAKHAAGVDKTALRASLNALREAGVVYFRDGGDGLNVSVVGRRMAADLGVEVVTPVFAIHKKGRYGSIVGRPFEDMREYRELVAEVKRAGGDYIKIMASGIITFCAYGELSCPGLEEEELREMVRIAHGEGFRVMTHVNGAETVRLAAEAGVDSVEHGYFVDTEALNAMAQRGTIWVPTLAAVEAFIDREGFDGDVTRRTLKEQQTALGSFAAMGGIIAAGSDSGAVGVPHGAGARREYELLAAAGISRGEIDRGSVAIRAGFRRT